MPQTPLASDRRFSPVQHVLTTLQEAAAAGFKLTTAARLLAVVLAHKGRATADGRWVCWRGRDSLARLAGIDRRTVTATRALLKQAGLFSFITAGSQHEIVTATGKRFVVKKGLLICELVYDPPAFRIAREQRRVALDREEQNGLSTARLALQRRLLVDRTLTPEQYEREVTKLSREFRQRRRVVRGENGSPKDSQSAPANAEAITGAKVIALHATEETRSPLRGDQTSRAR